MFCTVPLVVIFTKFDGQIASESVNLTAAKDEDKWERAKEIAEDRKSTRLNSSHLARSRMPSSA